MSADPTDVQLKDEMSADRTDVPQEEEDRRPIMQCSLQSR